MTVCRKRERKKKEKKVAYANRRLEHFLSRFRTESAALLIDENLVGCSPIDTSINSYCILFSRIASPTSSLLR